MKPFDSEPENIVPGVSEERFLRAASKYARSAYPNPDRIGCPERSTLEAIARRKHFPAPHHINSTRKKPVQEVVAISYVIEHSRHLVLLPLRRILVRHHGIMREFCHAAK